MSLKFVHLRMKGVDGGVAPKGGATLAWRETDKEGTIIATRAVCCSKDHYNKKIGRAICINRFADGDVFEVEIKDSKRPVDGLIAWHIDLRNKEIQRYVEMKYRG